MTSPAAFLDRDGTLIRDAHYLSDPDLVELLPGIPRALRRLRELGYRLVVITNQSGIARGYFDEAAYARVAARLDELLATEGVRLDLTLHCPHHPDFTGPCACRKPGLGLYHEAVARLRLDPSNSLFVGDKPSDVEPARAFGGRGWLVRTGEGRRSETSGACPEGARVVDDLAAVVRDLDRLADGGREGAEGA